MKAVLSLFAVVAAVAATVVPEEMTKREYCPVGDPQTWIMDKAYSVCKQRGCNEKVLLALFETGTVESNWNDLDCGDQDSQGYLQQRPSMKVWGTAAQIRDVGHATNVYLDIAIPGDKSHPWFTAGQLAQFVQGSERPNAYTEAHDRAQGFLDATRARHGGGGGGGGGGDGSGGAANVASKPGGGGSKSVSTSSKGGNSGGKSVGAPKNVAPGTIKSGCQKYYTVTSGNTCFVIQQKFGIKVAKFLSINKGVHSSCNNLQVGKAYCVVKN